MNQSFEQLLDKATAPSAAGPDWASIANFCKQVIAERESGCVLRCNRSSEPRIYSWSLTLPIYLNAARLFIYTCDTAVLPMPSKCSWIRSGVAIRTLACSQSRYGMPSQSAANAVGASCHLASYGNTFLAKVLEACVKSCGENIHAIVGKFRFLNEIIKMVSPKYHSDASTEVKNRLLMMMQQWNYSLVDHSKVREAYKMLVKQGLKFPTNFEIKPALEVPCGPGYLDVAAERMLQRTSSIENDKKKADLLEKLLKSKDPNDLIKANKLIKKMVDQDAKKSEAKAEISRDLEHAANNVKLLTDMLQHFSPGVDSRIENNEVIQDLYRTCKDLRPKMFKIASELDSQDEALGKVLTISDDITRAMDLYESIRSGQQGSSISTGGAASATGVDSDLLGLSMVETPQKPPSSAGSLLDLDFGSPAPPPASTPQLASATPGGGGGLMDDLMGLGIGSTSLSSPTVGFNAGVGQSPAPASVAAFVGAVGAGAAVAMPPLSSLSMSVQEVQPGDFPPPTIYNANNIKIVFHFAKNTPHPSIAVVVITYLNFGAEAVTDVVFQAAVPKVCASRYHTAAPRI